MKHSAAFRTPEVSAGFSGFSVLVIAASLVAAGGCGQPGLPGVVPISGRVTLDGEPLPSGEIRYLPKSPEGRMARGRLDDRGRFELTTLRQGDGALPGEYEIVILAPVEESAEDASARRAAENAGPRRRRYEQGDGPASLAPLRYTNPDTSGLRDTVSDSHDGYIEIELTSES